MTTPEHDPKSASDNQLLADDPQAWAVLIDDLGPASMLVAIEGRLGVDLRSRVQAEDIWQETLLHAWRDRARCVWTDVRGFRRWLLGIIDHRIADARDFFGAKKRAVERERPLARDTMLDGGPWEAELMRSTTPSRVAVQREQADQMMQALAAVPDTMREVLRLRLFEGLTINEISERLEIGESAAKHRYRKAATIYRDNLHRRLASRSDREL